MASMMYCIAINQFIKLIIMLYFALFKGHDTVSESQTENKSNHP